MHFKTHSFNNVPIDINIKIDNIFLEKKTSTKFLGVVWTTDYHGVSFWLYIFLNIKRNWNLTQT